MDTPQPEPGGMEPTLAVTPHGRLRLVDEPALGGGLEPRLAGRVRAAFERGGGPGILHLGAAEVGVQLPAGLAFWRDVGRLFMTRFCAVPDLEEHRTRVEVPAPRPELQRLVAAAPPMVGGEYLTARVLEALWADVALACGEALLGFRGTVQEWLHAQAPAWNLVGRVHFHLAERKRDDARPFAFMATYTTRLGAGGSAQHLPLGRALADYTGAGDRAALLALLRPVQAAAEEAPFLKKLVDDQSVFHPQAWSANEAWRFLQELPRYERAGVVVRVPDWWSGGRPARARVQATVGSKAPAGLGQDALLDFSVDLVLDGEALSEKECRALLAGTEGLALVRGKWVEVDAAQLRAVLDRWKAAKRLAAAGMSFAEAMRFVAGASLDGRAQDDVDSPAAEAWTERAAGPWLQRALDELRGARAAGDRLELGPGFTATLRPYQEVGVRWLRLLRSLGLGGCLADDMGLGKTVQVLALLLLLKRERAGRPSILVVPASLLANWAAEAARFTPGLRVLVAHPSAEGADDPPSRDLGPARLRGYDVVVTSYGYLAKLPWAAGVAWELVVCDEAQAIKNPGTRQARAAKALNGRCRLALTGTPIENRLGDLWSLFDFANPGLLGSAKAFGDFTKRLERRDDDRFGPLRRLVHPWILRRMKSDPAVIQDLPPKTEVRAFCALTRQQAALYQGSVETLARQLEQLQGIQRRGVVLAMLTRLKQICNHPSHWLGDGAWAPEASGKFARLRELCEELAERQEKALVFTQYREVVRPLGAYLASLFGRPGLALDGSTPVKARRELVQRFQEDDGVPFFVVSLKAGGTGLNLTAATHVIHFDRWWNPAVEDQATDRAWRIGQTRGVLVHKFVCRGTVEEKVDALLQEKRKLSADVLEAGGEALLTELPDQELLRLVSLDLGSALQEG